MSILQPSILPVLTTSQKQANVRQLLESSTNELFSRMIQTYNRNMLMVWANPDGLTPQQVFDSMGTDASELVRLAGILKDTVNTARPGTLPANPPKTLTSNIDGTITVGA